MKEWTQILKDNIKIKENLDKLEQKAEISKNNFNNNKVFHLGQKNQKHDVSDHTGQEYMKKESRYFGG